jgi:hypothetical protein
MLGKPFLLFLILFHCSRHLPFSCAIPDLFTTRDLSVSPAYVPSNYLPVDSFKDFVLVGTRPQSGSQLESPVCLAFLSVLHPDFFLAIPHLFHMWLGSRLIYKRSRRRVVVQK